jgi:SAM-dependent methyltransferase
MRPDPAKVRVWEARAPAYDRIARRWPIFPLLSRRLVELLPADLRGPVLDIGAGSGLTSEHLLRRFPQCEAILVEPSEAMLGLARRHLAGRPARFLAMGLDGAAERGLRARAAIASASMHFLDLEPAFATLAEVIAPRGHLAFNLWWHHWEDTAGLACMTGWKTVAETACRDAGLPPPTSPAFPVPVAKTRAELASASSRHGFRPLFEQRDEDLVPVAYGVDYLTIDPDWPIAGLAPQARQAVLAKMEALADGTLERLISTRFLFQRAEP